MDTVPGSPEYQAPWYQKLWAGISKRAPFYIGRLVQMIMYFIFNVFRFIGQMFRDAMGK